MGVFGNLNILKNDIVDVPQTVLLKVMQLI